jgi:hypothetical protein
MKTEITTKEKFDSGLVVSTAFNCQIACQNSNPCQVNIYITKIYSVKLLNYIANFYCENLNLFI